VSELAQGQDRRLARGEPGSLEAVRADVGSEWLLGRLLAAAMTVMTMMATGDEASDAVTYTGPIRATSVRAGA